MCGIFGYIGKGQPSIDKIKILGILNDDRGGDSCGIFINGSVSKGIHQQAKFAKFIQEMNLKEPNPENNTIIGHTRKKSRGAVTLDNAHPFVIKDKKNDVLVGVHNGTISNADDILEEEGIDDTGINVDSEAIFTAIAFGKSTKKVLESYKGKAVLVWTKPSNPDTVYIFKGASKEFSTSTKVTEERPLFYWRYDDGMYISSTKESLLAIGAEPADVKSFNTNRIYVIKNGKITHTKKIDRENQTSTTYGTNYGSNYYGGSQVGFTQKNTTSKTSTTKSPYTYNRPIISEEEAEVIQTDEIRFRNGLYVLNEIPVNPINSVREIRDAMVWISNNEIFDAETIQKVDVNIADCEQMFIIDGYLFDSAAVAQLYLDNPDHYNFAKDLSSIVEGFVCSSKEPVGAVMYWSDYDRAHGIMEPIGSDYSYEFEDGFLVDVQPIQIKENLPVINHDAVQEEDDDDEDESGSWDDAISADFENSLFESFYEIDDVLQKFSEELNEADVPKYIKDLAAFSKDLSAAGKYALQDEDFIKDFYALSEIKEALLLYEERHQIGVGS